VDKRFFGLTGSQWTSAVVAAISALVLLKWAIEARSRGAPTSDGDPSLDEGWAVGSEGG
jgi:hypothetical protein